MIKKRLNIILFVCGIMSVMSCQHECLTEDGIIGSLVNMTVEAVVDNGPETKTSLGGTNGDLIRDVLWNTNDTIAFFASGSSSFAKFINQNESDGQETAVFSGAVEESKQYAAFYPYGMLKSLNQKKLCFSLPAVQTYALDDFADDISPMIAKFENERLSFMNLCGILVLNLAGEGTVSSISFAGYDENGVQKPVAGDVVCAYDYTSEPEIDLTDAKEYKVTLNCGDGVALSKTSTIPFHILLPPGQYHDFKLIINLTDGRQMVKVGVNPIIIKRSERTRTKPLTFVETDTPVVDLNSSGETANSYIISESGKYKFKTMKGNSSTSVGSVSSVEVLWESFGTDETPSVGSLVTNVSYKDGYIQFSTPANFREGNAVIAAKNSSGEILWSWHIWLTDQPDEQVYANNAGTMMDRNLGATSATPGDVGALGLLYQWGRKDPFLGSSSISSSVEAKSTGSWPTTVSSSSGKGTIDYATKNPMTFITNNASNYDWYYTGDGSTDNTRWKSSKTIYDPCPPGWRVPDGGINGVWAKAVFNNHAYDDANEGMLFGSGYSSPSAWYPASGYRVGSSGSLYNVGIRGDYWSVAAGGKNAYGLYFDYYDNVFPSNSSYRAYGQLVRCLKEGSSSESPSEPVTPTYEDLSASGAANSYIVSEAGDYKFKTVKGNSSESVGSVSSVEVLWESFGTDVTPEVGDLVREVSHSDGCIQFSTPEFREGNAVIAAKNSSGTILWSWHIWLTDQPEEQVYYNNAGTMMDRNLGATSATPDDVGALGLLYQWGRKDPFIGASSISNNMEAKSTGTWAFESESANTCAINYSIKNPMTFILGTTAWYYNSYTDFHNRWQYEKTIYDPCPTGWQVPEGGPNGIWAKSLGTSDTMELILDINSIGINFTALFGDDTIIWYPLAGSRDTNGGQLCSVGEFGYAWSSTLIGLQAHTFNFFNSGKIAPYSNSYLFSGKPVRCVRE